MYIKNINLPIENLLAVVPWLLNDSNKEIVNAVKQRCHCFRTVVHLNISNRNVREAQNSLRCPKRETN